MITVTNGSVSRTYRPADFEGRTVTLSFTLDPGDDVDVALLRLSFLCEKHARQLPPLEATGTAPVALADVQPVGTTKPRQNRKPPVHESLARVAPEDVAGPTTPSEATAPSPAPEQEVAAPSVAPSSEPASDAEKEISNQDIGSAIAATHARLAREFDTLRGDDVEIQKRRAELIIGLRNSITGVVGMPVAQMDQVQRRLFVGSLATLAPAGNKAPEPEAY